MKVSWEPCGKRFNKIDNEVAIFLWENELENIRSTNFKVTFIHVHDVQTNEKINIHVHAKPHLLEYIAMQSG